jgi:hypothetical protein
MILRVRFAGLYEFTANKDGGWTVYLNDLDLDSCEPIGHFASFHEAWTSVGQPALDEDEDDQ